MDFRSDDGVHQFFVNAVHEGDGLYQAKYVCRFAGKYTVTVTLLGT